MIAGKEIQVGMGQLTLASAPERLRSVLGSCIGLAVYHPRTQRGALAHIILPTSQGRDAAMPGTAAAPGKFADTAVAHIVQRMTAEGARPRELVAKLAGGANMFNHTGPLQIGEANVAAVCGALATAGIRVAAKDVGGNRGRRITFDCTSGELLVEIAGAAAQSL